jgi:hypothetical protein
MQLNTSTRVALGSIMLFGMCGGASAQVWNPTPDFVTSNGNPNGVWTYGWAPADLSQFYLMEFNNSPAVVPSWFSNVASDGNPGMFRNLTGGVAFGVPAGALSLHSGPGREGAVLRWTNPQSDLRGSLIVSGAFLSGDFGTPNVMVRVDGEVAFSSIDSGVFEIDVNNRLTERVEFLVYGDYFGASTPLEVTLTFVPACPADYNEDGGVDGADVEAFFSAWVEGAADFNEDGGVDGADVEAFFVRWSGGC